MNRHDLDEALNQAWYQARQAAEAGAAPGPPEPGGVASIADALRRAGPDDTAAALEGWMTALARRTDQVSVVATGLSWLGGGIRSVEQTLVSLVADATQEILVTAYSVTSGSGRVMERVAQAASTGVRCVFVINQLDEQPSEARASLTTLAARYPASVAVYDYQDTVAEGLHAKVLVVDRKAAVIGSANLTFHGMTSSHELGLLVRGPTAASVASAIDRLTGSPRVRRVF